VDINAVEDGSGIRFLVFGSLRASTSSRDANPQALDYLLVENHKPQDELIAYKFTHEAQRLRDET